MGVMGSTERPWEREAPELIRPHELTIHEFVPIGYQYQTVHIEGN
jgi:hypothetical protein